ncbi:MAG: S1 RNA-binding domain-containing protein [Candidatus Omnitrophica bacterium]|nr:S1 RNA-binding domain-containing protein [Candidatus Omnitrophota bacterium]
MDNNLRVILQQLEAEKSVDRATLIEAIRSAIESAARKSMVHAADVVVDVVPDKLEFKVYEIRRVAETVTDPKAEISLEEARKLNPGADVGHRIKFEAQPQDFGRIAAQTAKQVIIHKIKDAERDNIFEEFKGRVGDVLTGIVKRTHQRNVIVTVDKVDAIIPPAEQAERENLRPGDRVKGVVVRVEKGARGAAVVLSRATPDLVRRLFEMEVPEIFDGTIEIKAIAREAGSRTKVAVLSKDSNGNLATQATISNFTTLTATCTTSICGVTSGQTVSGTIFVQPNSTLVPSIKKVSYYLNGTLYERDYTAPFTWGGTAGIDTTKLANGTYTLSGAYTTASWSRWTFMSFAEGLMNGNEEIWIKG